MPAILFFDLDIKLTFCNKEASEIIDSYPNLYEMIHKVCLEVKNGADIPPLSSDDEIRHTAIYRDSQSAVFGVRAFLVGGASEQEPRQIMVLIEKIVEKHSVDLQKARDKFHLSKRELEVLNLIAEGLTNKEIAERLFIGEHTTKDHVKNIMRKVNVKSRSALISAVQ